MVLILPFLLLAVWQDIKYREVDGYVLLGLSTLAGFIALHNLAIDQSHNIWLIVGVIVPYLLYRVGVYGGADAKIIMALNTAFFTTEFYAMPFCVVYMAVAFIASSVFWTGWKMIKKESVGLPLLIPVVFSFCSLAFSWIV
jgi:Flp pilus assembly protein protease CpaA